MIELLDNLPLWAKLLLFLPLWVLGLWLRDRTYRIIREPPRFTIWSPFFWLWDKLQEWRERREEAQNGKETRNSNKENTYIQKQ